MFKELHRDVAVLMASRGVRAFAFSYLNVIFAIYLSQLGYSTDEPGIGFLFEDHVFSGQPGQIIGRT